MKNVKNYEMFVNENKGEIIKETVLNQDKVNEIILLLKELRVDGETMQEIIKAVGLQDQMLRQLIMSSPISIIKELFDERKDLSGHININDNLYKLYMRKNKKTSLTNQEVFDKGDVIDDWASDVGGSNNSVDNVIELGGVKYLVVTDVEGKVLNPNKKAAVYTD